MLKNSDNTTLKKQKLYEKSLYEPYFEKDNCGMGFVASIKNEKSNKIVQQGIQVLIGLEPPVPRGTSVFKTGALNRSAISPLQRCDFFVLFQ